MTSRKPTREQVEDDQAKLKGVCPTCRKPIRSLRKGSLTGWIFGEGSCTCGKPAQPVVLKVVDEVLAAAVTQAPAVEASAVEPASFPDLGSQYQIIELIGQGGMGFVFKVNDRKLNRIFAIKVLRSEFARDKGALKRFEQEAEAACRLTHANLGTVYQHGQTEEGAPYLVMGFLDGVNLSDVMKKEGTLSLSRFLDLFIQVCEGLEHAHNKGVIHRDLKPSNIILTKTADGHEQVHLVDFGIAKVRGLPGETLTQTGDIFGSPIYMSPEQCEGSKIDERSDIYSLGCTMFEVLSGKPPFAGENPLQVMMKKMNDPTPALVNPDVSREVKLVIQCCLNKDPTERYDKVHDLYVDLLDLKDHKSPRHLPWIEERQRIEKQRKRYSEPRYVPPWWHQFGVGIVLFCIYMGFQMIGHKIDTDTKPIAHEVSDSTVSSKPSISTPSITYTLYQDNDIDLRLPQSWRSIGPDAQTLVRFTGPEGEIRVSRSQQASSVALSTSLDAAISKHMTPQFESINVVKTRDLAIGNEGAIPAIARTIDFVVQPVGVSMRAKYVVFEHNGNAYCISAASTVSAFDGLETALDKTLSEIRFTRH